MNLTPTLRAGSTAAEILPSGVGWDSRSGGPAYSSPLAAATWSESRSAP